MITVINFSHPLNKMAKEMIAEQYGDGEARIIDVHVQVEMKEPLLPQVERILAEAVEAVGGNRLDIDCYIGPGLAPVAAVIARRLPHANMLVLAPQGTPAIYLPSQLVKF